MSRFIESIRFEKGEYHLLEYHQDRINRVFKDYYNIPAKLHLNQILDYSLNKTVKYKCRLVYDQDRFNVEYSPYTPKKISSLKIVVDNQIDYSFKFEDRDILNSLYSKRDSCDDIIIVRNNLITDSSYANILFQKKENWYTSDTPLLKGVQRRLLIDTGKVVETQITLDTLFEYSSFMICNSMLPFDDSRKVGIEAIVS